MVYEQQITIIAALIADPPVGVSLEYGSIWHQIFRHPFHCHPGAVTTAVTDFWFSVYEQQITIVASLIADPPVIVSLEGVGLSCVRCAVALLTATQVPLSSAASSDFRLYIFE